MCKIYYGVKSANFGNFLLYALTPDICGGQPQASVVASRRSGSHATAAARYTCATPLTLCYAARSYEMLTCTVVLLALFASAQGRAVSMILVYLVRHFNATIAHQVSFHFQKYLLLNDTKIIRIVHYISSYKQFYCYVF